MLILLSPAKRLDFESPLKTREFSKPRLLDETQRLAGRLKELSSSEICKLMGVSEQIGELNYERFQNFSTPFDLKNARQALLAFKGDVYKDIDVENYSEKELELAQRQVRILSGMYGVLRALDLMQPYRLEMHTKMANERGKDLYEFWGDRITEVLNQDLDELGETEMVNLASQQYFKVVNQDLLKTKKVVTPVFKERKDGKVKIIALYAKLARGTMTNFAIKNGITKSDDLKEFAEDGYKYAEEMSTEAEWVFVRG